MYSAELIPVQSTILRLRIIGAQGERWDFLDSFRLLPGSLDKLAQTFLGERKVDIKHDYENLMFNPMRYDYLRADCVLLYRILQKYRAKLEGEIGGRLALSIAGCAMKTFQMSHLEETLESGNAGSDRISRDAYYGGRVEVFKKSQPQGTVATLYDVNSMYPWAMTQEMPVNLVGVKSGKSYAPNLEAIGFVKCRVEVPRETLIPVLPYRQGGKLIFPTGRFHGTWSTVELRRAIGQGAKILRHYESAWFRGGFPFLSYVATLYKYRNKAAENWNEILDIIAKLLLNSLYGKFGSKTVRETLHINPPLDEVIKRGMTPLDSPIATSVFSETVEAKSDFMLPHLAAWTTGLSRVRWHEGATSVPYYSLLYGDTDSITATAKMPPGLIGSELGQWKIETEKDRDGVSHVFDSIVESDWVAPKVYTMRLRDGYTKSKAKGFSTFGGERLGADDIAKLQAGESLLCSRFSKARTVFRGTFGMVKGTKRLHLDTEKRVFSGNESRPIHIEEK
jgi:hypothetical protein